MVPDLSVSELSTDPYTVSFRSVLKMNVIIYATITLINLLTFQEELHYTLLLE